MIKNDDYWMLYALKLAEKARLSKEVPVGAVLIDENNNICGEGYNRVVTLNDSTAHAEMLAIKNACITLDNHRLVNTTLYVTLEPCSMCAGAIVHSRIKRLVFGARDLKTGAAGSVYNLLNGFPLNHQVQIDEGIRFTECCNILQDFFEVIRSNSNLIV